MIIHHVAIASLSAVGYIQTTLIDYSSYERTL